MTTTLSEHDLAILTDTDINTPIDPTTLTQALHSPPFIPIPGIINLRDLGLFPSSPIAPGLIYRSGALHNLPASSLQALQADRGIKLILDLRSARERDRSPDPVIEGVQNIWLESSRAPQDVDLSRFVAQGGRERFKEMYLDVLEAYEGSVRAVLEWVRGGKGAVLVHCTAGKDRTGVLAALLLALAGAPKEVVAYDYALTRIGVAPAREMLVQMLRMWSEAWTAETPGMAEFASTKGEFIEGLLEGVEERFGGVEGYVRGLGFGEEDLGKMKKILRGG
ncbi:hypothetical protein BU23DRAFT_537858 [Bimuria novae-zelandiae CBS 107.79]|uniref:Tyrosine specific protein phosphatases domain-containing protein n=1 Tax=Bimuria novae-zelandiae CBS 107.79 TaxID=1447943 RepID=A0A6A5V071_9PLEO|nr:hypothetical protein BU23DRAFT_537858 [Bimuria novae-zelandiae CBS 107.79]